jgi:hypothetical protein
MRLTADAFRAHVYVNQPPCDLPRRLAGKHSRYHLYHEPDVACLHSTICSATGPAVTTGRGKPRLVVGRCRRAAMRQEVPPPIKAAQAVTEGLLP